MSSDVGSRIAKNSVFNFLRAFLSVPITLLISPFIILSLGKEEFGIWALVGVISSYAALSDFGITESLIKFIAEYKAKNDDSGLNKLINTSLTIYVCLSLVCCTLFVLSLPYIVREILCIPPALEVKANYVFTIAIIMFFVNMTMGVFGSLIAGFQRMGYSNLIGFVQTVLIAFGTFFFIWNGFGIYGLVYNNVLISVFAIVCNVAVAKRLFPLLRINPVRYFDREVLSKIFGFSWKVQLTNITQLMVFQVDRIFLSHYVGLSAVAYYELANRIATQARGFVSSILGPMVPAASELFALDAREKIAGLYSRSIKYLSVIAIPFLLLIVTLASSFVKTWMGPGYELTASTMIILSLVYLLLLYTNPGSMILSGIGKPEVSMRSSILAGVTNVILSFVLVKAIGYYGVMIGITISIVISESYFIHLVHQNIDGLKNSIYWSAIRKPLSVGLSLNLLIYAVVSTFDLKGYPFLVSISTVYFIVYVWIMLIGKYFDDFDRQVMLKMGPLKFLKGIR